MMAATQRVNLDPESRALIYNGASVNQLAEIFKMRPNDVQRRLGDLLPVGTGRQGNPLYSLADAAAKLVKPDITPELIDQYMRSVNHTRLPPMTSKFYWEGKRVREKYRTEANELWHTEDVVRVAAETFQSLRMSLMLVPDNLRDEAGLNDNQFVLVRRIIDETLEGARVRLVDDLQRPDPVRSGSDEQDREL